MNLIKLTSALFEHRKEIDLLLTVASIEGASPHTISCDNSNYGFSRCTVCFKDKTITADCDSFDFDNAEDNKHYYALMGIAANFNFKFIG